jgi:cytosine/adenosine deaminase-related metal-dependent hydrolase
MKSFSAQYVLTNTGTPLKRGIITTDDEGTIISIEDTGGNLKDRRTIQFYNGIIIPGFVNCHCHLELSHLKGAIAQGISLGNFIKDIRNNRNQSIDKKISAARSADREMSDEGIVLCADISNTTDTFTIKKDSSIQYVTLLEVFGIDPAKAGRRMDEIIKVAQVADKLDLPYYMVPHSVYALSVTLLRLLRKECGNNEITSVHFMESAGEKEFLENHSGELMDSYIESGLISAKPETAKSHSSAILCEITPSGNLLLVHNTFADRDTIKAVKQRGKTFWCLCPRSNIHILNKVSPVEMLLEENCDIIIGTDSLASNSRLSILDELKTLQKYFPDIPLTEIISWATINGARALNSEKLYGKIEQGKRPGLVLLENIDLVNMKFLPETSASRLI